MSSENTQKVANKWGWLNKMGVAYKMRFPCNVEGSPLGENKRGGMAKPMRYEFPEWGRQPSHERGLSTELRCICMGTRPFIWGRVITTFT